MQASGLLPVALAALLLSATSTAQAPGPAGQADAPASGAITFGSVSVNGNVTELGDTPDTRGFDEGNTAPLEPAVTPASPISETAPAPAVTPTSPITATAPAPAGNITASDDGNITVPSAAAVPPASQENVTSPPPAGDSILSDNPVNVTLPVGPGTGNSAPLSLQHCSTASANIPLRIFLSYPLRTFPYGVQKCSLTSGPRNIPVHKIVQICVHIIPVHAL